MTIIIEEIEIEFITEIEAKTMESYCTSLGLNSTVSGSKSAGFVINVYDIPEAKLGSIRRRHAIESFTKSTVKVIDSTRDAIISGADFATYRVMAPVAQAGIKAVTGISKVVAKSTVATASTLIGSTLKNIRETHAELKIDTEMLHAEAELKGAWGSIKSLFGMTDSAGVKIIKP